MIDDLLERLHPRRHLWGLGVSTSGSHPTEYAYRNPLTAHVSGIRSGVPSLTAPQTIVFGSSRVRLRRKVAWSTRTLSTAVIRSARHERGSRSTRRKGGADAPLIVETVENLIHLVDLLLL